MATSQRPDGETEQEQPDRHRDDADEVADAGPAAAAAISIAIDVTVRRVPNRAMMAPDISSASTEPTAMASRTSPSSAGVRCNRSRTWGMRDAQLAKTNPFTMNAL